MLHFLFHDKLDPFVISIGQWYWKAEERVKKWWSYNTVICRCYSAKFSKT